MQFAPVHQAILVVHPIVVPNASLVQIVHKTVLVLIKNVLIHVHQRAVKMHDAKL